MLLLHFDPAYDMWQTDIIVLEFTCWPPRQERLASSLPHLLFIKVSSPVFAHTHVFWWARYVMSLSLRSKRIVLCPCVDHVVVMAAAMREKCSSVSVRSPCTRMFASSGVDCYLVLPRFSLPPACFSCGLSFFFFLTYLLTHAANPWLLHFPHGTAIGARFAITNYAYLCVWITTQC